MKIKEAHELISPFFKKTEIEILDMFGKLSPNSINVRPKLTDYAYTLVPGTRPDRALLVAHVDTVWHDSPKVKVAFGDEEHPCYISGSRVKGLDKDGDPRLTGFGIGADDRAGVANLWGYRDLGHTLLLVNGEEYGSLGSNYLMSNKKMVDFIQSHSFAVQFDRHGSDDLVFYNVGTKAFREYCEKETEYYTAQGTRTDICVLCRRICGVNISVGYVNEHTCGEFLNITDWIRTYETCRRWLSKPNLPRFER